MQAWKERQYENLGTEGTGYCPAGKDKNITSKAIGTLTSPLSRTILFISGIAFLWLQFELKSLYELFQATALFLHFFKNLRF